MTDSGTDPGQQPPASDPTPNPSGATDPNPAPFFVAQTQDDFNKKAGITREGLRSTVTTELLTELGVEKLDDLKGVVEDHRAAQELTQTEADKLRSELEQVKPNAEKADRYETALNTLLEKEREGLPEHITSLLDGRDPDEQLSWIANNREAISEASRPATVGRGSAPGSSSRSTLVGIDKVRAASGL